MPHPQRRDFSALPWGRHFIPTGGDAIVDETLVGGGVQFDFVDVVGQVFLELVAVEFVEPGAGFLQDLLDLVRCDVGQ